MSNRRKDVRPGSGEGHLPASEAGTEILQGEKDGRERGVRTPASEDENEKIRPGEEVADDGRPGKGSPGTIPPPD